MLACLVGPFRLGAFFFYSPLVQWCGSSSSHLLWKQVHRAAMQDMDICFPHYLGRYVLVIVVVLLVMIDVRLCRCKGKPRTRSGA